MLDLRIRPRARVMRTSGVHASLALVVLLALGLCAPAQAQGTMTFFVTSVGSGKGADLGGIAGADQHCQMLAQAVGAGNKTWRAYLSTQGPGAVNARDRVGTGPWTNAKGVVVAKDVAELHGANNLTKQTALTEKGAVVNGRGDTPNMHDVLTGSQPDGTAFAGPRRPHLRQLDEERPGRGDGRPLRPHRARRERPREVVELVASLARAGRRLQPGRPQEHGRRRALLLLRDELTATSTRTPRGEMRPPPRPSGRGRAIGEPARRRAV